MSRSVMHTGPVTHMQMRCATIPRPPIAPPLHYRQTTQTPSAHQVYCLRLPVTSATARLGRLNRRATARLRRGAPNQARHSPALARAPK